MKELLKKKSIKIALLLIVVAVIAVIVGMNVQSAQKEKEYNAHIEAAEKYLTELDYEQAIAEYTLALAIEPNAEEVLNGLEKTYLAYADSLADAGEYEKAIQILNEGYAQTGRESLQEKIAQIQEMQAQAEEEQAQAEALNSVLVRIAEFCQNENYERVFELMQSEEYGKLLDKINKLEEIYRLDTEYGKIGIYKVDSETYGKYMIYYGEYEGDNRQGKGVWLGYFDRNNYMAIGDWTADVPQGEFVVREWYNALDDDVVYRVISGNVDNGLWNGEIIWKFEEENGTTSYPVTFVNGKWQILGYDEDGDAIVSEASKEDSSSRMFVVRGNEDEINGIVGFVSSYN